MRLLSLLSLPGLALRTPGMALRAAASALRVLASVNEQLAEALTTSEDMSAPTPAPAATPDVSGPAAPAPVAPAPLTFADPAIEPASFDVKVLAAQTAPAVIAALDTLSTEDLAELYEHESNHRRRRTVLSAIEKAAAPPPEARDEIVLDDDVREPDVLVYSTSTPGS